GSEASLSQTRLTFTPDTWDVAQSVTVTGVDDVLADGDITVPITVAVDESASDSLYRSVPDTSLSATTLDDDIADFVAVETGPHTLTREGGNTDTIDVMLTAAPTTPVVIDVVSRDGAEVGVLPASVTFDASNWNIPQAVTVNAVDDSAEDGKRSTFVDFDVNASSNAMFLGRSSALSVTTIDNDSAIYLDDVDLVVDATIEADTITLDEVGSTINVTMNGMTVPFDTADYDQIFIQAKPGDDVITATSVTKPLRILGGGGNDLIFGGSAGDTIRGGGGKDTISGGAGADSIGGGNKRDAISGGLGLDSLQGGRGADELNGDDGSDSIQGQNGRDTIIGGNGHDTLAGNNGPDSILGQNGDDFITGGGGDDTIHAGSGEDVILGGSGNDEINGEGDGDLAAGGSGNDTILGNDGRDVLLGGTDVDIVSGHDGEDILFAGRSSLSVSELISVFDEWNSGRTYQQRVDNIHDGPEKTADRLNTAFLIGPNRPASPQTAFDDGKRDELTGAGGNDFFFANVGMKDTLDNTLEEWVDLI
ncbi:MAG: calcium-binding protein, partial [Planctomycetaceae bacterium]